MGYTHAIDSLKYEKGALGSCDGVFSAIDFSISGDADRLINGNAPAIKVKDSRLQVMAGSKVAGQIMFEEDSLYYLVTPLFLQKAAKAELHTEGIRNTRKPYMDATMILHVDTSKKTDMTEKINEEIRSTLDSARTYHE